jgi:hypothetical protein
MRFPLPCRWLPLLALAALGPVTVAEDRKDDGFKPLFNGKDFTGWKVLLEGKVDPAETFSVRDGVIVCTGHPHGYLYTDGSYKNYVIRCDWRFVKPEEGKKSSYDSGLFVHIHPPHRVWPRCVEVQGAQRNHGILYFLGSKKLESKYDQAAKDKAIRPIGEWNTTEATCNGDGTIVVRLNGTEVSSGKSDLTDGPIGLQSEGAEVHFRNIKIKEQK